MSLPLANREDAIANSFSSIAAGGDIVDILDVAQGSVGGTLALRADTATTCTKTDVNDALDLKADHATTFTKSEGNTPLALKSDHAKTYTKTDIYSGPGNNSHKD